ncbi:hypothetical protein CWI38_0159p0060 [Hamiltosporidium tvaerminnensis]|uniref:Uncharacterized protein n=1 Tax=Hamiltosporidium tvaerminnensis TaxID=1176355 RepID=A0A4Q9M396_9MICR|nr:hypothetical protein CWI38_0159p0060 [Hamiltosporidium tvaerminnensis]
MNTKWTPILLTILKFIICSLNRKTKSIRSVKETNFNESTYIRYETVDDDVEISSLEIDKYSSPYSETKSDNISYSRDVCSSKDQINLSNNCRCRHLTSELYTIFEGKKIESCKDKNEPDKQKFARIRPKSESDLLQSSPWDLIEDFSDASTISDVSNKSVLTDGIIGEETLETLSPCQSPNSFIYQES